MTQSTSTTDLETHSKCNLVFLTCTTAHPVDLGKTYIVLENGVTQKRTILSDPNLKYLSTNVIG